MDINLDFSNVASSEPIPAGTYPCVIDKVEAKESQSSDFPYLNWIVVISEGDHKNRKIYLSTSLNPNALWKLRGIFEELGVFTDGMTLRLDDRTKTVLEPQLSGLPAQVVVEHSEWQGKVRAKGADIKAPLNGHNGNGNAAGLR